MLHNPKWVTICLTQPLIRIGNGSPSGCGRWIFSISFRLKVQWRHWLPVVLYWKGCATPGRIKEDLHLMDLVHVLVFFVSKFWFWFRASHIPRAEVLYASLLGDVAADDALSPSIVSLNIKISKTDQGRVGCQVVIGKNNDDLRPVTALLDYLARHRNHPGTLFQW